MIYFYIVVAFFFIYFVVSIIVDNRTEKVLIAFAGAYDGGQIFKFTHKDRNRTIFTEGEDVVDLSKYRKFLISGDSLSKVGLLNNTYVYIKHFDLYRDSIYSICNCFVIFRYDNDRLAKEHPEITNPVDSYKARKVNSIFKNHMDEVEFKMKMRKILSEDAEITNIEECIVHLWKKYLFASQFYKTDNVLIVSITYKNGVCKDYSFHSIRFLEGIVKYKSIS